MLRLGDGLGTFSSISGQSTFVFSLEGSVTMQQVGECPALVIPVAFNCTIVAASPTPSTPVVGPKTMSAAQSAISLSIAAATVTGPGGASDLQAMVLVTLARCSATSSASTSATTGGYKLLTPFAVSDTAIGAIGGNAAAFGCLIAVQLCGFAFLRHMRKLPLHEAAAGARFPGYALLMAASLHQSTIFAAIRLAGGDGSSGFEVAVGVLALLASIALPACVVYAAARVPRRFVLYDAEPGSRFATLPWRPVVPTGTTLPQTTRLMASSLITAFVLPSPGFVAMAFVSSLATNIVALLPQNSPIWLCAGAMYVSAAVHLVLAVFVLIRNMYRFPSSRVFGTLGFGVVGVFHAQLASGWRGGIETMVTIQSVLSILRSAAAIGVTIVEGQIQRDAKVKIDKVLWMIGNGGCDRDEADAQEMSPQLSFPLLAALPAKANTDVTQVSDENIGSPTVIKEREEQDGIAEGLIVARGEGDWTDDHPRLNPEHDVPMNLSDFPSLQETAIVARPFGESDADDDLMRLYRGFASAADDTQLAASAEELVL